MLLVIVSDFFFFHSQIIFFVSAHKLKKSAEIYYSSEMWLICKIMQIKMQLGSNSLVEFSIII